MGTTISLVCKVVLAVTVCTSTGKLGLTPQQAAYILTKDAVPQVYVAPVLPNAWHASTPYVRREPAPVVGPITNVVVNVTVEGPRSYYDELRAQGALVYHIPGPYRPGYGFAAAGVRHDRTTSHVTTVATTPPPTAGRPRFR